MPQVYGNTTGLSPAAHKALERVYRRRVPLDSITTPELTKSLVDASRETGRQVGALIHRSGQIDVVLVGDATRLLLPDVGRLRAAEGRLRGLRLVHTHLFGEELTRDDYVDLVRLRLDLVAAVQLAPDGEPKTLHYAYNIPVALDGGARPMEGATLPYRAVGPVAIAKAASVQFGPLIASLEDEFSRRTRTRLKAQREERALLVHVGDKTKDHAALVARDRLRELAELARTAGVQVADTIVQLRDRIDPRTVLGKGKLDDVVLRAAELDAEVVIFDQNLTPTQAATLTKHTDLKVLDRTQLILDIFAQHAESADGKLQVELAQLKYALPRLGQKDDSLSRLTGGIGGRGPGETKLEIGRRRARERVSHLESELKRLSQRRAQRRQKRTRADVPVVSIVGYTNAGKSTLLNTLTHADVIAEDKLFATLDPRSRRLRFPEEREVVITDTVGFIRDLPEDLFRAFRATFEEVEEADLILHVVDASDPAHEQHIATTEGLLRDLDLDRIPRVLVMNKIDKLEPAEQKRMALGRPRVVFLSARDEATTAGLLARIAEALEGRWADARPAYARALAEAEIDGLDRDPEVDGHARAIEPGDEKAARYLEVSA